MSNWNLAASDYYSLVEVLKHEAKDACSVAHGVSAVNNDKTIIVTVIFLNHSCHLSLLFKCYTAGVDQIVKLVDSESYALSEW